MKNVTMLIAGLALLLLPVPQVVAASPAGGSLVVPLTPDGEVGTPPAASQTLALDLQGAFTMALQRNLNLKVGRYGIASAEVGIARSTGIFDPNLTLSVSTDDAESPVSSGLEGSQSTSTTFGLGLTQLLPTGTSLTLDTGMQESESDNPYDLFSSYWGGSFSLRLAQPLLDGFGTLVNRSGIIIAHNTHQQTVRGFEIDVIDTLQEVESAYWDLIARREAVKVKEQSLELAKRLLNETDERVKVGTSAPIDLVQSEAGVARVNADLIGARNLADNAEDTLKAVLGFDQPEEWLANIETTDTFETEMLHPGLAEAIATGLERRPEVRQKQLDIEYRELQVKLARNGVLPNLDLDASYTFSGVSDNRSDAIEQITGLDYPRWMISLALKMPIGNHDARAGVAQARYQLEQARVELEALKQQIIREVRTAVRGLEDGAAALEASMASSELARRNLEAEQTKFDNGLSTNYQVLEIQEDLDNAMLDELQSRINYRRAILAFRVATGTFLESQGVKIADAEAPDEPHKLWKDVKWLQFVDFKGDED